MHEAGKRYVANRLDLSPQDHCYMLLKVLLTAFHYTGVVFEGAFMRCSQLVNNYDFVF